MIILVSFDTHYEISIGSERLGHRYRFSFWRCCRTVSQRLPMYPLTGQTVYEYLSSFVFSSILSILLKPFVWVYGGCGFVFLMSNEIWACSHMLISHWEPFARCLFQLFAYFYIRFSFSLSGKMIYIVYVIFVLLILESTETKINVSIPL